MRFTVIILNLTILFVALAQTDGFSCPSCIGVGPNPQDDCRPFVNPVCGQPQCIAVYKPTERLFYRGCTYESKYQKKFEECKEDPGCQIGRCFTSGCLAPVGFTCPTCIGGGPTAQENCESNFLHYLACEYRDRPQCIVYKKMGVFIRQCASENMYREWFKSCKADPGCQMGRCFTAGCMATLGEN